MSRGKPYSSSRGSGSQLTKGGYARPKKVRFQTLPKASQGFRRANTQGSLFQREGAQTLKTLVPVLAVHLGADKRGSLLNRRCLFGCGQMDKISKIGWFTRREGLV